VIIQSMFAIKRMVLL